MTYGLIIIISLILIFFVGRSFNQEKKKTQFIFTTHWLQYFKKWLDVSGWTKLVYKISYDKYEEVYEGTELESIKKTIENIVLKNIDNRISSLWVSDYNSYTEIMDGKHYIVVEIWWVSDLDQAKEIIGKTVELEFRLPNTVEPTAETIAERSNMAIALRDDILLADWSMEKLASNRWSEWIIYEHLTWVSAWDMPNIIQNHPELLQTNIWEISPITEWLFYTVSYQNQSGLIQQQDYSGFTFIRVNDRQEISIENATANDIINVITEMWNEYENNIVKESNYEAWEYWFENWNLIYNLWDAVDSDNELSNVKIVQVDTEATTIWADEETTNQVNEENEKRINSVKDTIKDSDEFDSEYATLIADNRASNEDILASIPDFDATKIWEVQTISNLGSTYVIYITEWKAKWEHLYNEVIVKDVDEEKFQEALKSKVVYDIEFVFVQDRVERMTAKTSKWDILNGAYFKYAAVSQWQMWEPVVAINFDDKGKEVFCDITAENIWTQMAIFVWWELMTNPVIQSKICGWTAQIDGSFTSATAKELVDNLNNWAMPAALVLMQEDKVSPTLGERALQWALIAALVWTFAIFLYIRTLYWRKKWFITLLVLLSFIAILAWIMKLINYALSLSWIAAVILSIWMAVDSNILIYERMKEEIKNWRSNQSAIDVAYDRSRPAIRDGNISTILIAILLWAIWSNMFKWFWFMLVITTLMTLFINVPITKILLKLFYKNEK